MRIDQVDRPGLIIPGSSRGSQFVDNDMTVRRMAGSILSFTSIQLTRLKMIIQCFVNNPSSFMTHSILAIAI